MELRHKREEADLETICDYCPTWREIALYQWLLGVETVMILIFIVVWFFG